jgi:hypothetical protein
MTTLEVINHLCEAGLSVTLQPCGNINLRPTKLVTPAFVNIVKGHKQNLIKYFNEKDDLEHPPKLVGFEAIYDSDPLLKKLLNLGSQISDYWNDSDAARAEMMASILSYPPNKREALAQALISSLRTQQ